MIDSLNYAIREINWASLDSIDRRYEKAVELTNQLWSDEVKNTWRDQITVATNERRDELEKRKEKSEHDDHIPF